MARLDPIAAFPRHGNETLTIPARSDNGCEPLRREGVPVPQEPAYAAERRQDAGAKAASERAKDRMSEASVRRRGMGSPEPTPQEVTRCQAGHSAGLRV
jgi:hypothetical protein